MAWRFPARSICLPELASARNLPSPAWPSTRSASRSSSDLHRQPWSFSQTRVGSASLSSAGRSSSHPHLERIQELQDGPKLRAAAAADILRTEDGNVLYRDITSKELLSTLLNLYLVAYEPVVDLSIKILRSSFRRPILGIVKRTAYSHFCAGEDVAEASKTLQRTWELGLKGILDYSLEDATGNVSCDRNTEEFLHTIRQTQQLPNESVSFSCVKITALCPLPLLQRISELLRWQHKNTEFKLPWREDALPVLADESPTYHVQSPPEPLSSHEERDLLVAKERLWKLCRACDAAGLPLLVDAEYTSVQPAIDYLTYAAALEFNRSGQPLVYGTIQAYLRDALPRLALAATEASRRKLAFGVKVVRGAYISRESELAASKGAASPIHSCIEDTHRCYDTCAAYMMERATTGDGAVVLATHNFDSGRAAAAKAEELGIAKGNLRLQFAQLKGMADGLSLALVHAAFQVRNISPLGLWSMSYPTSSGGPRRTGALWETHWQIESASSKNLDGGALPLHEDSLQVPQFDNVWHC